MNPFGQAPWKVLEESSEQSKSHFQGFQSRGKTTEKKPGHARQPPNLTGSTLLSLANCGYRRFEEALIVTSNSGHFSNS